MDDKGIVVRFSGGPRDLSLLRLWEPPSFFTTLPAIHNLKKGKAIP